jgi:hypothetical protein
VYPRFTIWTGDILRNEDKEPFMPQDPFILLSYINTKLRDEYSSLDDLCEYEDIDRGVLEGRLAIIDYEYDADQNRFVFV